MKFCSQLLKNENTGSRSKDGESEGKICLRKRVRRAKRKANAVLDRRRY